MTVIRRQLYQPDCPIDDLVEHPENPRAGDESAIEASIDEHGFYGAVIVQSSTHHVIAGNHRLRDLRARGETSIPVLWLDVDDDEALRMLLNDNTSNDNAGYHNDRLLAVLQHLQRETERGLDATGFSDADVARLVAEMAPTPGDIADVTRLDEGTERVCPFCQVRYKDTSDGPVRLDFGDES